MADDVTFNRVPAETQARWKLVRQVCEESRALRDQLPTLNAADTSEANRARNTAYKDRAVFYGVTGFTLLGLLPSGISSGAEAAKNNPFSSTCV